MSLLILACGMLICAVVPATMFFVNLRRYRAPRAVAGVGLRVAVLIPARDEERNIAACVESVLASRDVELEVLVLDDASTDRTGAIVADIAAREARVRLVQTQALPAGWNGKQRACWLLAQETDAPLMLFLDADVRLKPDALGRCVGEMSSLSLLSGFPRQITVGWMEQMLLPLIHFVLLGFLPMGRMRKTTKPAYAAGCGQFFLAEREAYFASGGHAAIRETRHDGLRLPQMFRRHGYRTDIFDLTDFAGVRMYDSAHAVWMGLAKNATEGLAAPARIVPLTAVLLLGQVLPVAAVFMWFVVLSIAATGASMNGTPLWTRSTLWMTALFLTAFVASYLPRLIAAQRFKQPLLSALLHPIGVLLLLELQWYALVRQVLGRPVAWRARSYASGSGEEVG